MIFVMHVHSFAGARASSRYTLQPGFCSFIRQILNKDRIGSQCSREKAVGLYAICKEEGDHLESGPATGPEPLCEDLVRRREQGEDQR